MVSPLGVVGVVATAIGVAVSAGYWAGKSERLTGKPASPAAAVSADPAESQRRLAELERAIEYDKQRLALLEATAQRGQVEKSAVSAPLRPPQSAGNPLPPQMAPEEASARAARQAEQIHELAKSEPRDRSWAPGYEEQIRTTVQDWTAKGGTSNIESLSCRTSLCRLDVSHPTPEAQLHFLDRIRQPGQLPPHTAIRVAPTKASDGTVTTEVDFVRAGYPMPTGDDPAN